MSDVSVVALFCDDIRQEKNGTVTIVGVYPDNVNVASIPGSLLKLGVYLRIHLAPTFDPVPITTWMELPDGKEIHKDEIDSKLLRESLDKVNKNSGPYAGVIASFVLGNFAIPAAGRLKAMVQIGEKKIIAGALNIKVSAPKSDST
jgi:hypothetical protein